MSEPYPNNLEDDSIGAGVNGVEGLHGVDGSYRQNVIRSLILARSNPNKKKDPEWLLLPEFEWDERFNFSATRWIQEREVQLQLHHDERVS